MATLAQPLTTGFLPRRVTNRVAALRELEQQLACALDARDRAMLADVVIPEYLTAGDFHRAERILATIVPVSDPVVDGRIAALRAISAAIRGDDPDEHLDEAIASLPTLSEAAAAVVLQRIGVANFFARRTLAAEEYSLRALWLCEANGLRWLAARAASVLYGVHYHFTGDLEMARNYAGVAALQAQAAGDHLFARTYLAAQFDVAVAFAEWDTAAGLREVLRRLRPDETKDVSLGVRVGDAIVLGTRREFSAMLRTLQEIESAAALVPDRALIAALISLAAAGTGDDPLAKRQARRAFGLSRLSSDPLESAHLTIRRRLAGVISSYVSLLVGETHHGTRALESRANLPGAIGTLARAMLTSLRTGDLDAGDPNLRSVRGYAAIADLANQARIRRLSQVATGLSALSSTEASILRAVAQGKTNAEIAAERGVTRNAIERRLSSAFQKLGVKTRAQAVYQLTRPTVAEAAAL